MKLADLKKQYGDFYSPRFRVTVGKNTYTESTALISDLEVDTTLDGADRFSFGLNYRWDFERAKFKGMNSTEWEPGTPVEIWLGYGNATGPKSPSSDGPAANTDPIFVGKIDSLKTTFPAQGGPKVSVSGFGPLHDMTKGTKSYKWIKTTLTQVVDEVTGNKRPKPELKTNYSFADRKITEADVELRQVIQDKQHDYEFLKKLADEQGFELFTQRGVLYFRPTDPKQTADTPVLTFRYGESLRSFAPEISDAEQVGEVEVRSWDAKARKEIVGRAKSTTDGSTKRVFRIPADSKADAERLAQARLSAIARARVRGSGETLGLPEVVAGTTIELQGLSSDFNKKYYVTGATHRLGSSGYDLSFNVTVRAA
jgi:phage protein D